MLPIAHPLKYLSHSSMMTYRLCPHKFYLTKLSPYKKQIKREEQNLPGAVGSAFDAYCKAFIQGEGKELKNISEYLRETVTNPKHFDRACDDGLKLFEIYRDTGLPYLLDEGLSRVDVTVQEVIGDAMVLGKPDAVVGEDMPIDWKVRGYASSPKSPTQGWVRCWKKGKLLDKTHDRMDDYFEDINEYWAQQVTIYAFLLGQPIGERDIWVGFDELSLRQNVNQPIVNHNTVTVSQIRSKVSVDYQNKVFKRIQDIWNTIIENKFPQPCASKPKCYSWSKECNASSKCESFKDTFSQDEDFRKLLFM